LPWFLGIPRGPNLHSLVAKTGAGPVLGQRPGVGQGYATALAGEGAGHGCPLAGDVGRFGTASAGGVRFRRPDLVLLAGDLLPAALLAHPRGQRPPNHARPVLPRLGGAKPVGDVGAAVLLAHNVRRGARPLQVLRTHHLPHFSGSRKPNHEKAEDPQRQELLQQQVQAELPLPQQAETTT
jgi:hypothetical protein